MKYFILIFALFLVGCGGGSSESNIRDEAPINPPLDPDDPSHDTEGPPEDPVDPPTDPVEPVDPPVGAIELPAYWGFYGDSHTAGRGNITSSISPSLVFRNIWAASGLSYPARVEKNGASGRSLANTRLAFEDDSFADTPWIHTQESGNQDADGQRTPEEFGDTFEQYWREVDRRYPGSIKTYETAHSFLLVGAAWRDWHTTENWQDWGYLSRDQARSYNAEMLRRIAILAEDDIVVIPVYTAEYIDALIARIPGGYPSIEDDSVRHYNGTGNFMIALAKFKALGYDVDDLDFSTVTIHEDPATDTARKALCVDVINTASVP